MHAQLHTERTLLPRGLIQRRARFHNPEYLFEFEIGQQVTLECTGETVVVSGRMQVIGCIDEYVVELVDVAYPPLRVLAFQIRDASQ